MSPTNNHDLDTTVGLTPENVAPRKKIVLVTGCHGGIGTSICRKFSEEGWITIGIDMYEKENDFVDYFIQCDLSVSEQIERLFGDLDKLTDRIDCLVNNAAHQICKPFFDMEPDEFRKILDCNIIAPFHLAKLSLPLLKLTRGSIVNIGSVHSVLTSDQILAYATSKAGLVGMTKNLAIEYSKFCIRVNCVSPGAIDTPMLRAGLERGHAGIGEMDDLVFKLGRKHLVGRVGLPGDIAELVYFLGDNSKSEFITGANYLIDGGSSVVLGTEL